MFVLFICLATLRVAVPHLRSFRFGALSSLISFDTAKLLNKKYLFCLIRTYSAFCRLISQIFFVSLHRETKQTQNGTKDQNLRTFGAGNALLPVASAEVSMAEAEIVADTESRPQESGRPHASHLHSGGGTADFHPVGRALEIRASYFLRTTYFSLC